MTIRQVSAEGTAKDRIEKRAGVKTTNMTPEQEAIRERLRDSVKANKVQKEQEKQQELLASVGLDPVEPADAIAQEINKPRHITLYDGREVVLGPPIIPFVIVAPDIFDTTEDISQQKLSARIRNARAMNYVRELNGRKMPPSLNSWEAIAKTIGELGDLGSIAVMDAVESFWPLDGKSYWSETKKNM